MELIEFGRLDDALEILDETHFAAFDVELDATRETQPKMSVRVAMSMRPGKHFGSNQVGSVGTPGMKSVRDQEDR